MIFYSSDFHLFHKNIIKYSNRPFSDVEEMNRAIIDRVNEIVGEDDDFYLLGDVAFASVEKFRHLMLEIKCRNIHLVPGNHDPDAVIKMVGADGETCFWKSVSPLLEITDQGRRVVLCHYKMAVFNKAHYDETRGRSYQLFGHSHGSMPGNTQQIDVGVDCWDFRPVTLDQCIARMKTLPAYRSGDHHVVR